MDINLWNRMYLNGNKSLESEILNYTNQINDFLDIDNHKLLFTVIKKIIYIFILVMKIGLNKK